MEHIHRVYKEIRNTMSFGFRCTTHICSFWSAAVRKQPTITARAALFIVLYRRCVKKHRITQEKEDVYVKRTQRDSVRHLS